MARLPSLLFVALALAPAAALSTTLVARDVEGLTARSDAVAVVRVTATRTRWADRRHLVTVAECELVQALKGDPGSTLRVVTPGGELDGVGQRVPGAAELRPGDEVVVFLQRVKGDVFEVTGWSQGVFTVERTGPEPTVRPMPVDAALVRERALAPPPATLRALSQRVAKGGAR
ncbi:MAG: hypothetical protein K1X89_07420 [Myxococcaceae bacterium]|nr:hypothetical protein [Myxococcaceae bacterium]